jgi:hypothetical protein
MFESCTYYVQKIKLYVCTVSTPARVHTRGQQVLTIAAVNHHVLHAAAAQTAVQTAKFVKCGCPAIFAAGDCYLANDRWCCAVVCARAAAAAR